MVNALVEITKFKKLGEPDGHGRRVTPLMIWICLVLDLEPEVVKYSLENVPDQCIVKGTCNHLISLIRNVLLHV